MPDSTTNRARRASLAVALVAMAAGGLSAQRSDSVRTAPHYWKKLALGAASSVLLHETAHIATSVALGGHPTFGFDAARPTVYSGLDVRNDPRKQFVFSISGLVAQSLVDEAILDVPHARGGAFERGVLGGGIGTTIFYLTIGRRGSVSDVDFIARTRVMSKTEVTMLFGTIAAMHTWRVWRDPEYGNFFVRPRGAHAYDLGWSRRLAR